jgi:response regulator receiver domain-containing protein
LPRSPQTALRLPCQPVSPVRARGRQEGRQPCEGPSRGRRASPRRRGQREEHEALSRRPRCEQLSDADGVETLGRLRASGQTATTPVLALTAQAMHGDAERFLAAGFDGYVSKPVDIVELVDAVRRHCAPKTVP